MARPQNGGHVRYFPRHKTAYRLISVEIDGVRRQRFEHRIVMEKILGRRLTRDEVVHHKDENGLNNAPSNLEVMTQAEHQRLHLMTGPRKWPLNQAMQLREEGWTFEQIANLYGVTWSAIRKGLALRGVSTKDKRHGTNKWDFEKGKALYQQGVPMKEIAREVGVAPTSVRKALTKAGVYVLPEKYQKS